MYAAFPVNIIERIEVIRGPGSVLYGSNAFSMVINVVTKQTDKNNVAVTGLTGAAGALGAAGEGDIKLGDVRISAAGRYMKKADWNTTYRAMDVFTDPSNPSVLTMPVSIPDEAKGAYLDMQYEKLRFMTSYNEYRTNYFQFFPSDVRWRKTFGNLGYDVKVKQDWDMNFNVTANYATFGSWINERKSNDVVAEWTNHLQLTQNLRLIVGGLYNYIDGRETGISFVPQPDGSFTQESVLVSDKSRGNIAFYTQADYWIVKNLKLIGGLQANKVQEMNLDVVPRGGVIWYPVPRINVKALYSQAYRAASINELGMKFTGLNGNPHLKPEKVTSIDMGVNYLGDKIQGGINYFNNKQAGIIVPGLMNNQYLYINKGTIHFQGVELESKYYVLRNLFLTGSMLYQENHDEEGVKNVIPIGNFGAKAGISYRWSKGTTASVFNIYHGEPDKKYTTGMLNPKVGSYNILNTYCSFDMVKLFKLNIKQGVSFFVQGDNVLNKQIWLSDWGGTSDTGGSTPANPGRSVYLGLKASLR